LEPKCEAGSAGYVVVTTLMGDSTACGSEAYNKGAVPYLHPLLPASLRLQCLPVLQGKFHYQPLQVQEDNDGIVMSL